MVPFLSNPWPSSPGSDRSGFQSQLLDNRLMEKHSNVPSFLGHQKEYYIGNWDAVNMGMGEGGGLLEIRVLRQQG